MKHIFTITLFFAVANLILAQSISYQDGSIEYEDQRVSAIVITLTPQVDPLEDRFESWIDDNYNVNLKDKKMLFFDREFMSAKGITVPEISDRKIDLLVKVDQSMKNETQLYVFASFGYDNWITEEEYPAEYNSLKEIVYDFIVEYLPEYYSEKIEDKQEVYGDLTEELEDIESSIEENKEEIRERKEEINNLIDENSELEKELRENQKKLRIAREKVRLSKMQYENILDRINRIKE